jgi:predicted RNA methylase
MDTTQPRTLSLAKLACSFFCDSLRSRGIWGTTRYFVEQFLLFLRESFPDRRKSRFGDIDYDCDYGVDTTWARLSLSVRLRELFTERQYQPTVPEEFHDVIQQVNADLSNFIFIDLGSGKGRALLLACGYPFREIIGVEIQPELHRIAEENILRFDAARKCSRVTSLCLDARDFKFPDHPLFVYLFNPFPDYVLRRVIENLRESLRQNPRPAFVVYNTPWEKQIFEQADFLEKVYEDVHFQIYKAN